jgi:hypothetical protein
VTLDGGDLDYPISSARQLGKNFTFESFLDRVAACLNSQVSETLLYLHFRNYSFLQQHLGTEDNLFLQLTIIDGFFPLRRRNRTTGRLRPNRRHRLRMGRLLNMRQIATLREWCSRKKGLLDPAHLQSRFGGLLQRACIAICVAIGLLYRKPAFLKRQHWWRERDRPMPKQLTDKIDELYSYLKKPLYSALGDDDLPAIQRYLNEKADRQLVVYHLLDDSRSGLEGLFRGEPYRLPDSQVKLLFLEDHCALITSFAAFKTKRWKFCNQVKHFFCKKIGYFYLSIFSAVS